MASYIFSKSILLGVCFNWAIRTYQGLKYFVHYYSFCAQNFEFLNWCSVFHRSTLTTGIRVIGSILIKKKLYLFSPCPTHIYWVWDSFLLPDWLIDHYYAASSSTDSKSMSLNWRNHMQMIQICFIFDQGSLFFTNTISTDLNLKLIWILWKCPRSCSLLNYPDLFSHIYCLLMVNLFEFYTI